MSEWRVDYCRLFGCDLCAHIEGWAGTCAPECRVCPLYPATLDRNEDGGVR